VRPTTPDELRRLLADENAEALAVRIYEHRCVTQGRLCGVLDRMTPHEIEAMGDLLFRFVATGDSVH
jgi:hypothetical protein